MMLISILLVLTIERIATLSAIWRADTYLNRYFDLIQNKHWLTETSNSWTLFAVVFLPSLLLYAILQRIDNDLVLLFLNTGILMICIGCPALREAYKCFLQAANRGDLQACSMYSDQLGHSEDGIRTFGQTLVWLNYQHYAAIVIWFVVFGPAGAVFYTLARGMNERLEEQQHPGRNISSGAMTILDWLPVRITALGFLMVGHFSRALPVWMGYLPDPSTPAKTVLADVSRAAEDVEPDENDCTEEPCTLVRLAKRNVMLMVAVISVLTLSGWLI